MSPQPKVKRKDGKSRWEANPYDFYETPVGFVQGVLEKYYIPYLVELKDNYYPPHLLPPPNKTLDIGHGTGVWGAVFSQWIGNKQHGLPSSRIVDGIDITTYQDSCLYHYDNLFRGDFRTFEYPRKYNLIIGNPPFSNKEGDSLAEAAVHKAFEVAEDGADILMMFKSQFINAVGRYRSIFSRSDYELLSVIHSVHRVPFTNYTKGSNSNTYDYLVLHWTNRQLERPAPYTYWLDWKSEQQTIYPEVSV